MARGGRPIIEAAPLFVAAEITRLGQLEAERDELKLRMASLPPRSHRRVVLQARLTDVVAEILRLEAKLFRRGA